MKRSKLLKISIPLVIAIIFLSCTSTVYAASNKSKVNFRPLSEWEEANPSVFYYWFGWPPGVDTPCYALSLADYETGTPPPKGTYDGYIKERKVSDQRALVTVYLTLKNAPFWLTIDDPDSDPLDPSKQIFENAKIIEYHEVECFYIAYPGATIPNIFEIAFPDIVSFSGVGHGTGIFTHYAESELGFTSGEEGMMTMNQRALIHPAFQNDFKGALGDCFPVEIINVHEVG